MYPEPKPNPDAPVAMSRPVPAAAYLHQALPPEGTEPVSALLSNYLWLIWRHAWQIALFSVVLGALAYFLSKQITPVYESTATIDIDRQGPAGVVGQEAQQSASADTEQFIATQVRLIQSASVLRPVVERYRLGSGESSNSLSLQRRGAVTIPGLKVQHVPGTYIILITYRAADPDRAADIANSVAESYIRNTYEMKRQANQGLAKYMRGEIEDLRAKMEKSSAAAAASGRDLNYVSPEEKSNVLTSRLMQLNTELANAQTERAKKEAALNAVKSGSLESAQTSQQGETPRRLAEKLEEAQERFEKVKGVYGKRHPEYEKAASEVSVLREALANSSTNTLRRVQSEYEEAVNREQLLRRRVDELKSQTDSMSARTTQYQSRVREADSDRKLYEELMQKIKEASINSGFESNPLRIADPAQAASAPVYPNVRNNVLVAVLLSIFLGIGAVVLLDILNSTVRDPEAISRELHTDVVGVLPFVRGGSDDPGFDEAARALRNSILLSAPGRDAQAILFTSASPEEGKTTTSVHVAMSHAMQGRRTLLIDADLRRPGTARMLDYPGQTGLADVIAGREQWQTVVARATAFPQLDILPPGRSRGEDASFLEREMPGILREARLAGYDLIVVDAPPLLGFSETLRLAALVDGVVVVTRAGKTTKKLVAAMLSTLHRLRVPVIGVVLNGVTKALRTRFHYATGYGVYYSAKV